MSGPYDQSPRSPFKFKNSPDAPRHFRSPFPSPRNGNSDFPGSSKWRNNHWQNSPRFYFQNDHNKYHNSPRGSRRGGHFRGGGPHRGSPRNKADISSYVNPSMVCDPWKDLTELIPPRLKISTDEVASAETTPNDSQSSINTSASHNEITEPVTEDSVLSSDTSADISDQTI